MNWIKSEDREPSKEGFYTVKGLNNQGNPVDHTDKDKIWFTGSSWFIREGCKVTEWLDEEPKNNIMVLTLWQPWATLHAAGIKQYETRPKATTHKGMYLIHAADKFPKEARELCKTEPFKTELARLGYNSWNELPTAAIVGSVEYEVCYRSAYGAIHWSDRLQRLSDFEAQNPTEFAFGDYSHGRFVWKGKNHRMCDTPIPYKNGQGYYLPFSIGRIIDFKTAYKSVKEIGGDFRDLCIAQSDYLFNKKWEDYEKKYANDES